MKSARTRYLSFSALALFAMVGGSWSLMDRMDRQGLQFFETGAAIVSQMQQVASAIQKNDTAGLKLFYADNYRGNKLGLVSLGSPCVAQRVWPMP